MSRSSYGDLDKRTYLSSPIKVMVVDNKNESLAHVREFLASYSFKVTCVNRAGVALTMLTDEKADFDIILLDSDLRDVEMITFLRLTKDMDILKIVMKEDETDDAIIVQALDNGAFLVVKRELTSDFVTNARQHVVRERIQKFRKLEVSPESETKKVGSAKPSYKKTNVPAERKKVRRRHGNGIPNVEVLENERASLKRSVYTKRSIPTRKNTCVTWTKELHSKFLSVVQELGEGKCFPTTILDAMGVPGLTRMQVASHLQKCRHGWQSARKRGTPSSLNSDRISSIYPQDVVKFGRMPLDATHAGNPEESITSTNHATLTKSGEKMDVNLKKNQSFGESSLMNAFGLENIGPISTIPNTHQHGSVHPNFPPKQASYDLFDFMNNMEGDETFSGIQLHPIELNNNYQLEQVSQDDGQEMDNEAN